MRVSRTLIAAAVPCALGACLLVPWAQASVPTATSAPPASTTGQTSRGSSQGQGTTLSVTVPVVAFADHLALTSSGIHTPVLLTADGVGATVTFVDSRTGELLPGCAATLVPHVVTWVDCSAPRGLSSVRATAALTDGGLVEATLSR